MKQTITDETYNRVAALADSDLFPQNNTPVAVACNLLHEGKNEEALTYLLGVMDAISALTTDTQRVRLVWEIRQAIKLEVRK